MRKIAFVEGENYHIFNRGVDKRSIFSDAEDLKRFLTSMVLFNVTEPIGSIYLKNREHNKKESDLTLRCLTPKKPKTHKTNPPSGKLVEFVAFCLNPNHYHFILRQVVENGISEFMKRLGGGYTNYFNEKYKRDGSLFQGTFKSKHIDSNEYLLHLSVYVNLNFKVHKLDQGFEKFNRSSWEEYTKEASDDFCDKKIVLDQFRKGEYKKFARGSLKDILVRKQNERELALLLME